MKLRTRAAVVAGSVAVALALAACSTKTGTTTTPTSRAGGAVFNAATNGIYNPSDKKGGTLKLVTDADADSYDGARFYYAWMFNFSRYYLRTLVTETTGPGQASLQLTNDLAASQDISTDGLTYTYKLKSGVKFEDGSTITSKDVKYGIERNFANDVLTGGPTYLKQILDEGQHYPGPYKDSDPTKLGLKSVQTPDDNTIVFKLAAPNAAFPYMLAMGGGAPVPMAQDTGAKYTNHPVAMGPYRFASNGYQAGKSLKLVRNPNWDPSTDSVRKALPDEIDLTVISDDEQKDAGLLDGTYDIDVDQVGVQSDTQAKAIAHPDIKKNTDDVPDGFIRYFAMDQLVKPLDNIDCRKAVIYATDKVALQTARGGTYGGDIAYDMFPLTLSGHDNSLSSGYTGASGKPDLDKAKAALQACGQPNGFTTTLATQDNDKGRKTAEALQQALAQVGIKANIAALNASTYYSADIGTPSNVHKKGYGLMIAGWGADYPANSGFLQVIVDGRLIIPSGGNVNTAELNDPNINSLIDQANKETDPTKNAALWKQIDKATMDSATYVPFLYEKDLNYRNPRVTNVYLTAWVGQYEFSALGVAS